MEALKNNNKNNSIKNNKTKHKWADTKEAFPIATMHKTVSNGETDEVSLIHVINFFFVAESIISFGLLYFFGLP